MIGKKLVLAGLSSALLVGVAATASLAAPGNRPDRPRPHMGMGMGGPMREVVFVRMLKQFDTNKDGKITKEEATDGFEKIFAAIDTDKDGSLTPGELRKYHEAQMKDRKGPADEEIGAADAPPPPPPPGPDDDQAMNDDGPDQPPPPPRPGHGPDRDGPRWHHDAGMMRISMMIRRADTDENGQISKAEATAAFNKLFARMDRNKDGVISIDDMPDRPFL